MGRRASSRLMVPHPGRIAALFGRCWQCLNRRGFFRAFATAVFAITISLTARAQSFAVDANAITDFMIPDVCVDAADRAVAADPYACPAGTKRRNLKVGEEIPYVQEKTPTGSDHRVSNVYITYPVADGSGNVYEAELLDGKGTVTIHEAHSPDRRQQIGLWDMDVAGDTYGVIRWHGDAETYASVETRGGEGPNGWFSPGCRPADSWVQFPKGFVPFASAQAISTYSDYTIRQVNYVDASHPELQHSPLMFLLPPLTRRPDGLYRGVAKVCDAAKGYSEGHSLLVYGSIRQMRYESGKVMDTIYQEHFYADPVAAHLKHHDQLGMEADYYTREYGNSRWETWLSEPSILSRCQKKSGSTEDPEECARRQIAAVADGAGNGCPHAADPTRIVTDVKLYRVTCSDRTTVQPIPNTLAGVPIQPRVYHLSRELFGANQNWIANPDFAGGRDAGWLASPDGTSITVERAAETEDAQLVVRCAAPAGCTAMTRRPLLNTDGDPYATREVMTEGERQELSWLTALDAGVTLTSQREEQTTASLTVSLTGNDGAVIASGNATIALPPKEPQRLVLKLPFTYANLLAASQLAFAVKVDPGAPVALDDAYLFPDNTIR